MSGIPTKIDGTTYRSRVEARWAVMLEHLFPGRVEYEPFDADGYIPDFVVLGDRPMLLEVKAHLTLGELAGHIDRIDQALDGHWDHDVMLVGGTPFLADIHDTVAGLMRDNGRPYNPWDTRGTGRLDVPDTYRHPTDWAPAVWMTCRLCRSTGWHHETASWHCRPCGHGDGDRHIGPVDRRLVAGLWADARETTRWAPNAR